MFFPEFRTLALSTVACALGGISFLVTAAPAYADSVPVDYSYTSTGGFRRITGTYTNGSIDITITGSSTGPEQITGTVTGSTLAVSSSSGIRTTGTISGSFSSGTIKITTTESKSGTASSFAIPTDSTLTYQNVSSNIVTITGTTIQSGKTSAVSCTYNKSTKSTTGTGNCEVGPFLFLDLYVNAQTKQAQAQTTVTSQASRTETQMVVGMIERRISASLAPAFAAAFRPTGTDDKKKQKLSDASDVRSMPIGLTHTPTRYSIFQK
ncbi:MAG: hypothetical protein WCF85_00375, partial [Rhodospirillaceae bacterium]